MGSQRPHRLLNKKRRDRIADGADPAVGKNPDSNGPDWKGVTASASLGSMSRRHAIANRWSGSLPAVALWGLGCWSGGCATSGGPGDAPLLPAGVRAEPVAPLVEPTLPPRYDLPGKQYTAEFKVCVSGDGVVSRIGTTRSSGVSDLDQDWLMALRQWRYRPYLVAGQPQPFCHLQPVAVTGKGPQADAPQVATEPTKQPPAPDTKAMPSAALQKASGTAATPPRP